MVVTIFSQALSAERPMEVMGTNFYLFQRRLQSGAHLSLQKQCQLPPARFHSLFPLCFRSCGVAALLERPDLPFYRQQVENAGWRRRRLFAQREGISERCHDADEAPPNGCTGRKSINSCPLGHEESTLHRSGGNTSFLCAVLAVGNISPWHLFQTDFGFWNLQLWEGHLSAKTMWLVI